MRVSYRVYLTGRQEHADKLRVFTIRVKPLHVVQNRMIGKLAER